MHYPVDCELPQEKEQRKRLKEEEGGEMGGEEEERQKEKKSKEKRKEKRKSQLIERLESIQNAALLYDLNQVYANIRQPLLINV